MMSRCARRSWKLSGGSSSESLPPLSLPLCWEEEIGGRSMPYMHSEAAAGRWRTFSALEQMGNIGSEVGRTIIAVRSRDPQRRDGAFTRALELFDLTLQDPRWGFHRKREIARARELFCDAIVGGNTYGTDLDSLDRYFTQFAIAARRGR